MIYAYLRVSSRDQDLHKQKYGILEFCQQKGFKIDHLVEESVTSRVSYKDRELGQLLQKFQTGDVLVVSELSRLGRSIMEVMEILHSLMAIEVRVYVVKGAMELGQNIQSKVMAFAFSLAAEIERDLISARTKEALAKVKSEGKKLGRRKGSFSKSKLDHKEEEIRHFLEKKVSKASICKILDCSPSCLHNFIKTRKITPK